MEEQVQGLVATALVIAALVGALPTAVLSSSGLGDFLAPLLVMSVSLVIPRLVVPSLALGAFAVRGSIEVVSD